MTLYQILNLKELALLHNILKVRYNYIGKGNIHNILKVLTYVVKGNMNAECRVLKGFI